MSGSRPGSSRKLPSWMSSRDNESEKTKNGDGEGEGEGEGHKPSRRGKRRFSGGESSSGAANVSKLMDGVVFVLSGFVNPERSILRSQALEMGAEYQPDWNSECTLLVCAFSNTPKFRQVGADCGTIVSKEWISECYTQKKLVEIESYLMHAGKPWRKNSVPLDNRQDQRLSRPNKTKDGDSSSKSTASETLKHVKADVSVREFFSPSEVKKWAVDDLKKTIAWLESQDEKPGPDEINQIAAEGILTCLQDAIASLEQKQDVQKITEQWNFVPRVVEELAKLEVKGKDYVAVPKEDLCRQAMACKRIYEAELSALDDDSSRKKKQKTDIKQGKGETVVLRSDAAGYDSDETIEMTEDEIDLAYNTLASNNCNTE